MGKLKQVLGKSFFWHFYTLENSLNDSCTWSPLYAAISHVHIDLESVCDVGLCNDIWMKVSIKLYPQQHCCYSLLWVCLSSWQTILVDTYEPSGSFKLKVCRPIWEIIVKYVMTIIPHYFKVVIIIPCRHFLFGDTLLLLRVVVANSAHCSCRNSLTPFYVAGSLALGLAAGQEKKVFGRLLPLTVSL